MSGYGKYVLGSDIGTGGCKTVLVDMNGTVLGRARSDYPTYYPQEGWAEQNPDDWYQAFCETTRQILESLTIDRAAIACLAIAGVTHNPVLLDQKGQLLRPAIHFWDRRSRQQVREIKSRWGSEVRHRTLNEVDPLWTWPQLRWLRRHEPEVWKNIAALYFPKDYVRTRITGRLRERAVSDTIDPTGTLLYDPREKRWIEAFTSDLGLPRDVYPAIASPFASAGGVCQEVAAETGLQPGMPVITGTTDTAAEVIGAGALQPGQAIIKLASVGRIMLVLEKPLDHPRSLNYPHVFDGLWYPGSVTKHGADAYRWARHTFWSELSKSDPYRSMDQAAEEIEPGSQDLLFFPHLSGEYAPQWDPDLRASFVGLTIQHNRGHITRSVLEGVAYQIRSALDQITVAGDTINEIRLIGGGANSPLWARIMANVIEQPLLVPVERSAAYGAALLAGMAIGLFDRAPNKLSRIVRIERRLEPGGKYLEAYQRRYNHYCEIADRLKAVNHRMKAFSDEGMRQK